MTDITLDLADPLIVTWLQLYAIFEPLHQGDKAEVDRLHDVYVNSMPSPSYTVAVPGAVFDERNPKPGDHLSHIINPLALIKWVKEVSAKRGFPYNERQAFNLIMGVEDYG